MAAAIVHMKKINLSVVIPFHNEEESLPILISRLLNSINADTFKNFEIIFVNDGSTDNSESIIKNIITENDSICLVNLSRNFGHQAALTAGLEISRGEVVFCLDADLQDPPELLGPMYDKVLEGYDVVYGERIKREGESYFKKITAACFYRILNKVSMIKIPLDTGDFRLMTRRVVDELNGLPEGNRFVRGLVAWLGFNQYAFKYERDARFAGETKYPLYKMISLSIDALTAFTISPLRIVLYFSSSMILISVLIFIWLLYSYIYLDVVSGWTSIIALVTLFSSIILLTLSIIGEYVGRIFMQTKQRPSYLIKNIYGGKSLESNL